jgi:predicted DNA-binding transcriptional regulator YafY
MAGLAKAVTGERAARLVRLLQLVSPGPQTRTMLIRRLKLDMRGFYRDLEFLRASGISLVLDNGRYSLADDIKEATQRLPFPDPRLTLGEAALLAKGRLAVHRKLRNQIDLILKTERKSARTAGKPRRRTG